MKLKIISQLFLFISFIYSLKSRQSILGNDNHNFRFVNKQDEEDDPVKMKGFLRLASDQFQDFKKFPPIPDGYQNLQSLQLMRQEELKKFPVEISKKENFRINSQYKEGKNIPTQDSFFFRLTGDHLLYTEDESDTLVIQAIQIKNILNTKNKGNDCFKIIDTEDKQLILCSIDGSCPYDWRCAIDTAVGKPCEQCIQQEETILEIAPQLIIPIAAPNCKFDWNYNYHGQNWVCNCNEGLEQSPIDLPHGQTLTHGPNNFDYLTVNKNDLEVIYDINIFKIRTKNQKNFGIITDSDGTLYEGYEIQFHTPGEHNFQNFQIDMEIQVIHRAIQGDIGRQAILSVLWKRKPGEHATFFDKLDLLNLPNPQMNVVENNLQDNININNLLFDDQQQIDNPPLFSYYKYMGSRTAPPCEENVVWFISEDIRGVSSTVLAMIRDVLNLPLQPQSNTNLNFDGSNRMIQPLRQRKIYFFDHKKSIFGFRDPTKEEPMEGHYELFTKKTFKYQWFEGQQPSGIKNSLVTNENEANNIDEPLKRLTDRFILNW